MGHARSGDAVYGEASLGEPIAGREDPFYTRAQLRVAEPHRPNLDGNPAPRALLADDLLKWRFPGPEQRDGEPRVIVRRTDETRVVQLLLTFPHARC